MKILGLIPLMLIFISGAAPAAAEPFTPKSYIKAVLNSSLSMRQAEEAFKQAENAYRVALLDAALPAFNFSMADSLYDEDNRHLRFDNDEVTSRLSASLNLYDSASSPVSRIKTARLVYESAQLVFLTARQNEAVKALAKFYSLYSTQQKIITAKNDLEARKRQYNDTNEQFQSGTRSRINVTQSEGDKLQSELSLAQAEAAESKALMAFNELINTEPETLQEALVSTEAVNIKLPLPKEDVARALENNFSLRLQKLFLERARLSERNNVMSNYPRFKVDASWAKTDLGLLGTPGGAWSKDQTYGLGASLNFPFGFFGTQNYFKIKNHKSALKSSELELQDSIRSLKTQVLTAQKDIELQVKSRQLLEFQVKAQKEAADNLLSEFAQGGAGSLELDNAQTKLLDAGNRQITAINDLDLALANYRVLLGEKIWE